MRHGTGSLQQQQALLRSTRHDPPTSVVASDFVVVRLWIIGENRQFEPVLPLGFRVTVRTIAPRLAQHWQHIMHKAQRLCSGITTISKQSTITDSDQARQ